MGLNSSHIQKPPGSKKRNKRIQIFLNLYLVSVLFLELKLNLFADLPCEVPVAESVNHILEPREYLDSKPFSLGFIETETSDKPRFGGHQTLKERERSYSAINQTIHCGFVKGGLHQGSGFDLSEKDRAYMKNCLVSVSSCIFGSSDFLRRPATKKVSNFILQ